MDKQSHYIQAIQDVYPHLSIETVELKQHGQFNDILVVNQESIFALASLPHRTQQFQKNLYHFDKDLISEQ